MATRKDVHRPGMIEPSEYRYLFSYSTGGWGWNMALLWSTYDGEPHPEPVYGTDLLGAIVVIGHTVVTSPWGKLPYFSKAERTGGCDICGARYSHGDVWRHEPTGDCIKVGRLLAVAA